MRVGLADRPVSRSGRSGTGTKLHVEWYGSGVAISHRDDQPYQVWRMLDSVAPPSDDLHIARSRRANAHPDTPDILREVIRTAGAAAGEIVLVGDDAVDGAGSAPAVLSQGWDRHSRRLYRLSRAPAAIAEVVPAGILLRPAGTYASESIAIFDPKQWTIVVGVAGQRVATTMVAMLRDLLVGAKHDPQPVRLRLVGDAEPGLTDELSRIANDAGLTLDAGHAASVTAAEPAARSVAPPRRTPEPPSPHPMPPVVTMADPDSPLPTQRSPSVPTAARLEPVSRPWRPALALPIEDRPSTPDERHRFAAAIADRFTDLLAMVNGALASWPVLRRDDSPGAKADHVAVCLYLGSSDGGAVALNAALRRGRVPDIDAYLPCLVSGIRRLPLHRRAVLCQARLGEAADQLYAVGAVVTEPGVRGASIAGDVTVRACDVDFLIWPRAARQASVLMPDREYEEAVFQAGSRFKVLAVEMSNAAEPRAPSTAVLLRELLPNERPVSRDLDDADRAALSRLGNTLRRRRQEDTRVLEDDDVIARLSGAPLGFTREDEDHR